MVVAFIGLMAIGTPIAFCLGISCALYGALAKIPMIFLAQRMYGGINSFTLLCMPYLPIDPADIGRAYEPVVRINSQSGKGGAAFIMQTYFGYNLPKAMHPEFGELVKQECDRIGTEMSARDVFALFEREYLDIHYPYNLKKFRLVEQSHDAEPVRLEGILRWKHEDHEIVGTGNGPVDAFFSALQGVGIGDYEFLFYDEHAISSGADSKAAAYIQMRSPEGKKVFGVGVDDNISIASIKGVICAINRAQAKQS